MSHTPKGEATPVLGRKFCGTCGKWRLLIDFHVQRRTTSGTPLYWMTNCQACERERKRRAYGYQPKQYGRTDPKILSENARKRLRQDPDRLEARREYMRVWKEGQRRRDGKPKRNFPRGGSRDKGKGSCADAVDGGPFFGWLDKWIAYQTAMRTDSNPQFDRSVAGLEDLARMAGTSARAIQRARRVGRIQISIIDRVLISAGADVYLIDLYPDLYPDEVAA